MHPGKYSFTFICPNLATKKRKQVWNANSVSIIGDLGFLDYFFFFETPFRSTGNKSYFEFTGCMAAFQSFSMKNRRKFQSKSKCQLSPYRPSFIYHCKNIAKGTTDPRVEFILPKSYCKFKHKYWSNFIFRNLTQHQQNLSISTKLKIQNLDLREGFK